MPLARPSMRRSMAWGWSPVGSNGATKRKSGTDRIYHFVFEIERAFVVRRASRLTDGGAFWYHPPISTPVLPSRDWQTPPERGRPGLRARGPNPIHHRINPRAEAPGGTLDLDGDGVQGQQPTGQVRD